MTMSVTGTAFRRRSAAFSGLAAFALGVFAAGAWAGAAHVWPVRYSMQIIQGLPKPFVNAPETRPFRIDPAGRLLAYPLPRTDDADRNPSPRRTVQRRQ